MEVRTAKDASPAQATSPFPALFSTSVVVRGRACTDVVDAASEARR